MNIQIQEIKNRGLYEEERLILKAIQNVDLYFYLVTHTKYINGGQSIIAKPLETFWFTSKPVKANDLIVLYTKRGQYSSKTNADGSTSHFYYWNLSEALYRDIDDCAVVFETKMWNTSRRGG